MWRVKNCIRCYSLFHSENENTLCQSCREADEVNFKRIKEYLYEHPGASANEVTMELEIPLKLITHYLREGRLEVLGDNNFILDCERCGDPIKTGRYCPKCTSDLTSEIKRIHNEAEKAASERVPLKKGIKYRHLNEE